MGEVCRNVTEMKEKTDDDLGAPIFVRGKQIMTVNSFVREIDELRAASAKDTKKGYGNMLPRVLIHNDTPRQISLKKRELKKQSEAKEAGFQQNKIISYDDEEEEDEAAVDDPSGSVSPDRCSSPSSPSDLAERPRPASSLSSASYEDYASESDSLPDLSENVDPSYEDSRLSVRKEKSPKKSPLKEKKKKKKQIIIKGNAKLMKSAKMKFLQKQKMFIRRDKDKRVSKGVGRESDKSNISSTPEPQMKPQTPVQPYKTTGFVQLKPHAKSPKDVERGLQRMVELTTKPKEPKDQMGNIANMPPEEVRKLLRGRLDSPPSKKKGMEISQGSSNSKSSTRAYNTVPDCQETSHPDNSNHSYDSDETVTYEQDVQSRNAQVISDGAIKPESIKKRKSADIVEPNKRLKETGVKSPLMTGAPVSATELMTVTSPVHFASEMDGRAPFMIQHIEGGVHDAFGTPEKETAVSAERTTSSCIPIKKLTKQFRLKMEKKNECEQKLRDEREAYERRIAPIKDERERLEKDIEALLLQIQQFEEDSTAKSPPSHEGAALPTSEGIAREMSKQGPNKAINIIPAANLSNFGMVGSPSYSVNTSAAQATSESAAPQENMKKRGRPKKTNAASPKSKKRSPSPDIVLLESSSSSSSSKNATGTLSSHRHPNVYVGPDGLTFLDPSKVVVSNQHLANQNRPPSYAEAVARSNLPTQAQSHSQIQSISPSQHITQVATRPLVPPQGQSQSPLQHLARLHPQSYQMPSQPQHTHMQILPKNIQQLQPQLQQFQPPFQPQQISDPQSKGRSTQAMGPSSLSPDQQLLILPNQQQPQLLSIAMPNKPQQSQQSQGLYILPVSQGVSGVPTTTAFIVSPGMISSTSGIPANPMVSTATTSAPQTDVQVAIGGSSSSSTIALSSSGTIALSSASGATVQQGVIATKRNPMLNELLDQGKQLPGPLSSKQSHMLSALKPVTAKPNPQANQVTGLTTQLPAGAAAQESSIAQVLGSAVNRQVQPPQGSRPPPKSHLLVKATPSITSGVAAQARTQPSIVTPTVSSNTVTGPKTTAPLDQSTEHRVEQNFQDVSNEDEPTSSPEAEQSCFLCGSPGGFVCCNMIVYCSEDCKGKDWSRHETECTRSNS